MKTYQCKIESATAYSSSRFRSEPKRDKEPDMDFERRTWRLKLTLGPNGNIHIRAIAFKFALSAAARYRGDKVPGRGKSTFTKLFEAGIFIPQDVDLGAKPEDAREEWIMANVDGKRGSGKRVPRCLPTLDHWSGTIEITVLDESISRQVLEAHLITAGQFIGVGQYRPEVGGSNGRFKICSLKEI